MILAAGIFDTLKYTVQVREALNLIIFMGIGGLVGLFIRGMYIRFGLTAINRDGLSSIFPLLTLSTVLVIFVVKSSLALSLGLVGALSIVRFRAAIKEPEELVMLFFCIAAGLALGAEYFEFAIAGALTFAVFMVLRHYASRKRREQTLLLTITGPRESLMNGDATHLYSTVRELVGPFKPQRVDVEDGQVQFRAVVSPDSPERVLTMVAALRDRLPQCRISYVDLAGVL